jgi:hypothetical protein
MALESKTMNLFFLLRVRNSISMETTPYIIIIDVLCAFTYLYFLHDKLTKEDIQKHAIGLLELAKCYFIEDLMHDKLANEDIQKHAIGLLELAKCYFIEDLTSTV